MQIVDTIVTPEPGVALVGLKPGDTLHLDDIVTMRAEPSSRYLVGNVNHTSVILSIVEDRDSSSQDTIYGRQTLGSTGELEANDLPISRSVLALFASDSTPPRFGVRRIRVTRLVATDRFYTPSRRYYITSGTYRETPVVILP